MAVKFNGPLIATNDGNRLWMRVGSLLSKREGHRSIVIGNSIMHIGGNNKQ